MSYTSRITVQTISDIDEMTAAQKMESMEVLSNSMSETNSNSEPPEWHREYMAARERALANGEDSFISLDELEADLRTELK